MLFVTVRAARSLNPSPFSIDGSNNFQKGKFANNTPTVSFCQIQVLGSFVSQIGTYSSNHIKKKIIIKKEFYCEQVRVGKTAELLQVLL